jgi:hypothetical protein
MRVCIEQESGLMAKTYLTGDTVRLRYRGQPVNAMYDLRCSLR